MNKNSEIIHVQGIMLTPLLIEAILDLQDFENGGALDMKELIQKAIDALIYSIDCPPEDKGKILDILQGLICVRDHFEIYISEHERYEYNLENGQN